jgi:hypothetical protein
MRRSQSQFHYKHVLTRRLTNVFSLLIQYPDAVPEPQPQQAGQDLYFEVLELQPIRLSLSFMRTERVSSDSK